MMSTADKPHDISFPQENGTGGRVEGSERRVAINLYDLDHINPYIRTIALGGKLDLSETIYIGGRDDLPDEWAVVFSCDLRTAACLCDILRKEAREESG